MKKLPFFLLLLILPLVTISHVHSQETPILMRYVLQWPPTFCMKLNTDKEKPGRCKEPILQHNLTLHGLWPADAQGKTITKCEGTDPEKWDDVFTPIIEEQLMRFWPPLRENSNKRSLWLHEWKEHGKCARTTAQVYFGTSISINNMIVKGNLFNYLKTNGIIACDSLAFSKNAIVKAIQKVFLKSSTHDLDVYLTCITKNDTHVYLDEVTLCTNLDGTEFISCPSQAAPTKTSCPNDKIMLPHPKAQPPISSPLAITTITSEISGRNIWDISYI